MRCVPTRRSIFAPVTLIWAHGHIFKMAAGGGKEVLEENIEQQLSRIVKGQLFSKIFLFEFRVTKRDNNISCRRTLWKS